MAAVQAEGCILAHSMRLPQRRLKKGVTLNAAMLTEMQDSGVARITVARLDNGDTHEDEAALRIAVALSGVGIRIDKASTGRVNLFAAHDGLLCFDRQAIIDCNSIAECITVATLPENTWVLSGKVVATCKIITYGVDTLIVDQMINAVGDGVSVQPVGVHNATLIQTSLPTVKDSVLNKTAAVIKQRLIMRNAKLVREMRCAHSMQSLSAKLQTIASEPDIASNLKTDWILIAGASAISDRADVIPAALEAVGGQVIRYGLPVDPGNLLMLGELNGIVVLGLPGCARSPKLNGLDLLLDRLACGVGISQAWLSALSVGGLLTEMLDRPQPRVRTLAKKSAVISILVLAAGASRRAGSLNKLTVKASGVPMVVAVVNAACGSKAQEVVVVTGHQHKTIEALLVNTNASVTYCSSHALGMAHSLSHGISRLQHTDAVLVCLADMPRVSVEVINTLIDYQEENMPEKILVPVFNGRRGNPVLVGCAFYDSLLQHTGDSGAKFLMKQYPDRVIEVPVDNHAILLDYDTPEALSKLASDEN